MSDETTSPTTETASPADERAALAAELARLEAEREARAKSSAVADLRRKVADEKAIAAAEAAHGLVGKVIEVVPTDGGVVIVKRANPLIYRRFMDTGKFTSEACDALVRTCLVHPSVGAYEALIEDYPSTPVSAANAIARLAGVRAAELSGK